MKIYVSHSSRYDYEDLLYMPLKYSQLCRNHFFIFPHEKESRELFRTKEFFLSDSCDLVLAEVSLPSTGQGIELGWADSYKIPIICIYKKGSKLARSLQLITNTCVEYIDINDMVKRVSESIDLINMNK